LKGLLREGFEVHLKLRPFNETFDRGSRREPLRVVGEIQGELFVIDVDGARVELLTHRVERSDQGVSAWVHPEQEFALGVGQLRVLPQLVADEVIGAEILVRLGPIGATSPGFSVFFNLLGQVDGQGTVRRVSEPPVLN
jgi:hypothetical protein